MSGDAAEQVTVSEYILTRLEQVGVTNIYGVPGDFNLRFLDYVEDHESIQWLGCTNELNASYAADGYARVKGTLGVLVTVFGVGELSAANGIAGSYAESIPVLHVVGVPSTALQAKGLKLHHTLGDGRFQVFQDVYSKITCSQSHIASSLRDGNVTEAIDKVIFEALKYNKPTYLTLPTDLLDVLISAEPLKKPMTLQSIAKDLSELRTNNGVEDEVVRQICQMFRKATNPCILVDVEVPRFRIEAEVEKLIEASGTTFFTSIMAKSAIREDHPQFGGVYVGNITFPAEVKQAFESCDFILAIGFFETDFNTAGFSHRMVTEQTVELHHDRAVIQGTTYAGIGFRPLLPALTLALRGISRTRPESTPASQTGSAPKLEQEPSVDSSAGEKATVITHDEMWPLWAKFIKPNDVLVGEIGSGSHGLLDVKMPPGCTILSQILYASIGFAAGATLGAAMAAREQGRRTILFTGDGSMYVSLRTVTGTARDGICEFSQMQVAFNRISQECDQKSQIPY